METKDGLHIWEDHFYPEVVDPETGAVLPDGEEGELVFTSLTKQATRSSATAPATSRRLLPGTARSMRRMVKVTGRSDDMLIVRGVNVFPTQIEELVLANPDLSGHYQIELGREARMDTMLVRVEARPDTFGVVDGRPLAAAIKERIGVTARVEVVAPGGIERSLGKARRVIDLRPRS